MDTENKQAEFKGWALIEIMGHQKVAGFVETCAFGGTVMFRITNPAMPEVEQTLTDHMYINYKTIPAGSIIRVSREARETYVGVGSVYRMTPCTEEQAITQCGQKVEIVHLAESPKLLVSFDDEDHEQDEAMPF